MANELLDTTMGNGFANWAKLFAMASGLNAADNGAWMDARLIRSGSLEFLNDAGVGSISSFSAQIQVSNAPGDTPPANTTDGAVAQTVTTLGVVAIPVLARWIKVKTTAITVASSGTLGVRLHGLNY